MAVGARVVREGPGEGGRSYMKLAGVDWSRQLDHSRQIEESEKRHVVGPKKPVER